MSAPRPLSARPAISARPGARPFVSPYAALPYAPLLAERVEGACDVAQRGVRLGPLGHAEGCEVVEEVFFRDLPAGDGEEGHDHHRQSPESEGGGLVNHLGADLGCCRHRTGGGRVDGGETNGNGQWLTR